MGRFAGGRSKMGDTGGGGASKASRTSYQPSGVASSKLGVSKPAGTRAGASNQNDLGRFTSTARSRGGNLYAHQPTGNSRIYQRSDSGAISAFKTPSGDNSVGNADDRQSAKVTKNDGGGYNSPMIENGVNMNTGKAAQPSKGKSIQQLMSGMKGRR